MEGKAPASVAAGALGDVSLVSPSPMDVVGPSPTSGLAELFAAFPTGPVASSQARVQSTTDTTPSGSPTRLAATSITQERQQEQTNQPMTPETASSERSTSDGVPTPTESEKGALATQINGKRDQNGAQLVANGSSQIAGQQEIQVNPQMRGNGTVVSGEQRGRQAGQKNKMWFEVLPIVLQNFRTHNREQIRQLMNPRCELCERGKVDKKAEVKCNQQGCILKGGSLCLPCWKSTHSSDGARKHRRLAASICQQCQLVPVAYWCAECDLKFCIECFDQIHSVPRTERHRKLATEDAPGNCLAKSNWSTNFQNVIIQMIAARKRHHQASNDSSSDSSGGKRKRDVEVIVIDDEEDENESATNIVQDDSSLSSRTSEQPVGINGSQQNGSIDSTGTCSQVPVIQTSMLDPIPFDHGLTSTAPAPLESPVRFEAAQTSSAYNTSSMSNGTDINARVGNLQWNNSAPQFGAASSMANGSNSMTYTSNGMMQVAPTTMSTSVNSTGGVWSMTSAISTDLASTSNPNNLLQLGGAVFAENALVDSLVDRYHEVNQHVTVLELKSEQLTKQIAVATCQGPYTAGPIMTTLSKLQPVLEAAKKRRDKLLIAMIVQSNDIMACVRLLRLTELGDVPQVPMISHRKCLQISNEINQHKKKLIELNQTLSETLNQSHAVSSSWETTLIRTTSANIQMHEKSIKKLKKDREVEVVRIVQFSRNVREALKHAFQLNLEVQRQQGQHQQFQQNG